MEDKVIIIKKQLDQLIAANVENTDIRMYFEELLLALIDGANKTGFNVPAKQAYNQGITDAVKIYSYVLNKTVNMIDNEVIMKIEGAQCPTHNNGIRLDDNKTGPMGVGTEVGSGGTTGHAGPDNPCEDELPFVEGEQLRMQNEYPADEDGKTGKVIRMPNLPDSGQESFPDDFL